MSNLHQVEGGLLPHRPAFDQAREGLHKVEEHAHERRLDEDDEAARQDLPDAGHDAQRVRGERQKGHEAENDGAWKKIITWIGIPET